MCERLREVSPRKLAGVGLVLSLAPLYFVVAAVLNYGFGVRLLFDPLERFFAGPLRLRILNQFITPVLFYGGLIAALALNLYAIYGRSRQRSYVASSSLRWNVAVAALSWLLLATISVYAVVENFT